MVAGRIQHLVDILFEAFDHCSSWLCFKLTALALPYQIEHLHFGFVDSGLNLPHSFEICNSINHTNTETTLEDPVVGHNLNLIHESRCVFITNIKPCCMNKPTHTTANGFLVNGTFYKFTFLNCYQVIISIECIGAFCRAIVSFPLQIDFWQNQRHNLLPSPELLGLVNGRRRDSAIPIHNPHKKVEHEIPGHKHVTFRHFLYSKQ
mmetsp:Transcript_29626/g.55064  ORF Transcript_29626/g.55064 Transcript_29626/m.55064 type:complete len:206 (-) Transcript_29626:1638-2255(-)